MGWFQTLKEANKLDIVKEVVKVMVKDVPGGSVISDAIEGFAGTVIVESYGYRNIGLAGRRGFGQADSLSVQE